MNLKTLQGYYSTRHNLKFIIIMMKKNTYLPIRIYDAGNRKRVSWYKSARAST